MSQLSVAVKIADAYARRIATRGVADARQECSVTLVHADADAVTGTEDRGNEVRPAVTVKVAHGTSVGILLPQFSIWTPSWRVPSGLP